jgi:hypothetical protein
LLFVTACVHFFWLTVALPPLAEAFVAPSAPPSTSLAASNTLSLTSTMSHNLQHSEHERQTCQMPCCYSLLPDLLSVRIPHRTNFAWLSHEKTGCEKLHFWTWKCLYPSYLSGVNLCELNCWDKCGIVGTKHVGFLSYSCVARSLIAIWPCRSSIVVEIWHKSVMIMLASILMAPEGRILATTKTNMGRHNLVKTTAIYFCSAIVKSSPSKSPFSLQSRSSLKNAGLPAPYVAPFAVL